MIIKFYTNVEMKSKVKRKKWTIKIKWKLLTFSHKERGYYYGIDFS